MKLGVHLVDFAYPGGPATIGATLARVGGAAEEAGVSNLSAMDHYLQLAGMGVGDADAPMLEGYTTLAYLAGHTSTVELQLLVTGVTYRHPGLLAKIVSTLDVLSAGRAVLGLGAAWYEREHLRRRRRRGGARHAVRRRPRRLRPCPRPARDPLAREPLSSHHPSAIPAEFLDMGVT